MIVVGRMLLQLLVATVVMGRIASGGDKRYAAMPANNDVAIQAGEIRMFLFPGRRVIEKLRNVCLTAMHDADVAASNVQCECAWQRTHPVALLNTDLRIGKRVPLDREPVAGAALDKIAAAIARVFCQLAFDISGNDSNASFPNRFDGFGRLCAIRHDVARADNRTRRQREFFRNGAHSSQRLQVAVRAPEEQQRIFSLLSHFVC